MINHHKLILMIPKNHPDVLPDLHPECTTLLGLPKILNRPLDPIRIVPSLQFKGDNHFDSVGMRFFLSIGGLMPLPEGHRV